MLDAAKALAREFPGPDRSARIGLEKNLPLAAGLGGGSSDAAAALRGLARLWRLGGTLEPIAAKLGADVPVCLASETCRMRGIGEALSPFQGFAPTPAVLVNPGVPAATAAVFQALGLARGAAGFPPIDEPVRLAELRNDLIGPALTIAPTIQDALVALEAQPGVGIVRLSGSGPTCFGLFGSAAQAEAAAAAIRNHAAGWWVVSTMIG